MKNFYSIQNLFFGLLKWFPVNQSCKRFWLLEILEIRENIATSPFGKKVRKCNTLKKNNLYPFLVSSISFSVSEETFCFLAISSLRTLDELRIWMAVSSSNILPWNLGQFWLLGYMLHLSPARKNANFAIIKEIYKLLHPKYWIWVMVV